MSIKGLYVQRTTLVVLLISVAIAITGMGLFYLDTYLSSHPRWEAVVRELGALCLVTPLVGLVWELGLKRVFLDEILAKASLAQEIKTAGLSSITMDFGRGVDWTELLQHVKDFAVYFAYAQTWRSNNEALLRAMATRDGTRVRLVLPDPDDGLIVRTLAKRFDKPEDDVKSLIRGALNQFQSIFANSRASLEVWYTVQFPLFSFYLIDHRAILATYKHAPGRGSIPTLTVNDGGSLYQFLRDEFRFLTGDSGISRKVVDEQPPTGK